MSCNLWGRLKRLARPIISQTTNKYRGRGGGFGFRNISESLPASPTRLRRSRLRPVNGQHKPLCGPYHGGCGTRLLGTSRRPERRAVSSALRSHGPSIGSSAYSPNPAPSDTSHHHSTSQSCSESPSCMSCWKGSGRHAAKRSSGHARLVRCTSLNTSWSVSEFLMKPR